ncbi:MFS general substrate transporter [Penicillium waksmanii]|uniref:MFS general substrate transporter n=1 Tax=Penicillium waksmanii TaxID=69791 RepID=UPI00254902F3|nr:MFS general substrate transporter [Penicillium waksmanii]KAJ5966310.1 MFS general substrate transporter [Penicillium waksmanii]
MSGPKPTEQHLERIASPDPDVLPDKHAAVDEELRRYVVAAGSVEVDEATSKRLRRLIDKRVLIVMVGTYFLQSLDKNAISFAAIMGIQEDAHLVGQDYSWLHTVIYFGILFAEYPTNLLVQKLPIGKYLAANIFLWGLTLTMNVFGFNFAILCALRVLLGIFEAVSQPTFLLLSSMWYKREEQAHIVAYWYGMNGVQGIVGGLFAYGMSHVHSPVLKSWQLLFVLLGCVTCLWSVFVFWWMPDSPMRATCYSETDRILIIERVRANQTGIQNRKFKKEHVQEAIRDPQIWLYILIQIIIQIPTGGLGSFSTILIKNFGFSELDTELLSMVNGAVQCVVLLSAAWLSRHYNQTILFQFAFLIPNIAGTAVLMAVPISNSTKVGLLIAYWCTLSFWGTTVLLMSLLSRNVAGQTKKSVSTASLFLAWAVGNMIGPQVFQSKDAPRYFTCFSVHMGCYACIIILLGVLRWHLVRENNKRDLLQEEDWRASEANLDNAFDDLTDRENLSFRYKY